MRHRYYVVMPGMTARVGTLVEAVLAAGGRTAVVFESCDDCSAWKPKPVLRIEAGELEEVTP